jgi:hypothetical protein
MPKVPNAIKKKGNIIFEPKTIFFSNTYSDLREAMNTLSCNVTMTKRMVNKIKLRKYSWDERKKSKGGERKSKPNRKIIERKRDESAAIVKQVLMREFDLKFAEGRNRINPIPNPRLAKEAISKPTEIIVEANPTSVGLYSLATTIQKIKPSIPPTAALIIR